MIFKYLSKHTFFPKHSINLLNLKSSIFTSVTNSTLHTQISFHSCNTPYTFIFYLFTKTPVYATINFSLLQSTFSTPHRDSLYISNINFYKNSQIQNYTHFLQNLQEIILYTAMTLYYSYG